MGLPSSPQDISHDDVPVEEIEDKAHLKPENSQGLSTGGVSRGTTASRFVENRRRLYSYEDYDDSINAAADVFALTIGTAAFESAIPAIVRIVSEGYVSTDDDMIELTVASDDIANLFERNDVGDILRGAVLSPALAIDTYYSAAVTNLSPLFKLPVDAVQRGRDHGLPTYNNAREVRSCLDRRKEGNSRIDCPTICLKTGAFKNNAVGVVGDAGSSICHNYLKF